MPAVEPGGPVRFVLIRDMGLMESLVVRVLELGFRETFMVVDSSVPNQLDLRNTGNSLKIRMEDRQSGFSCLIVPVAIALGSRVKCLAYADQQSDDSIEPLDLTLVMAYCCSGERSTSRNRRASYL